VILEGYLPSIYYHHFLLLVHGILVLTSKRITEIDLKQADLELKYFLDIFQKIYGLRFVTLIFHLLRHLAKCVRKYGPLWTVSCFPFENANGWLVRCITGTHNVVINMVNSALALKNIRQISEAVLHPGCAELVRGYLGQPSHEKSLDVKKFGQYVALSPSVSVGKEIYMRAIINDSLVESGAYKKNPRRNNKVVLTKKGFFFVEYFFESSGQLHFQGKKLSDQQTPFPHPHLHNFIKPLILTNESVDLAVSSILKGPVLFIEQGSKCFAVLHGQPLEVN